MNRDPACCKLPDAKPLTKSSCTATKTFIGDSNVALHTGDGGNDLLKHCDGFNTVCTHGGDEL